MMRRIWVVESRYRVKDGISGHDWLPLDEAYWARADARSRKAQLDGEAQWTEYRVRQYARVSGAKG